MGNVSSNIALNIAVNNARNVLKNAPSAPEGEGPNRLALEEKDDTLTPEEVEAQIALDPNASPEIKAGVTSMKQRLEEAEARLKEVDPKSDPEGLTDSAAAEDDPTELATEIDKMQAELEDILKNEKLKPEQRQLLESALRLTNESVSQLVKEYKGLEGFWENVHLFAFIVNVGFILLGGLSFMETFFSPYYFGRDLMSSYVPAIAAMSTGGVMFFLQALKVSYLTENTDAHRKTLKEAHQRLEDTLIEWDEDAELTSETEALTDTVASTEQPPMRLTTG